MYKRGVCVYMCDGPLVQHLYHATFSNVAHSKTIILTRMAYSGEQVSVDRNSSYASVEIPLDKRQWNFIS